jgi:hypothetical protein
MNNYEKLLQRNMVIAVKLEKLEKAGFPRKTLEQIERKTHRELNEVSTCMCHTCGTEYGEHEKDKLMRCDYCGKIICPDCKDQHGLGKFNRDKYGMCRRSV